MKPATITASDIIDGKKVPAGQRDEMQPESLEEAMEIYGGEAAFLKKAWKSYVIEVQASLRNGGDSKTAKVKRLLAKIEAEPDGELAQLAKRLGFLG